MSLTAISTSDGAQVRELTVDALRQALDDGGEIALLDIREEGQFGEGHVFFANNIPYSRLEIDVAARVPRRRTRIVLIDAGDGVAARAARRLAALGYDNVSQLRGGIDAWHAAGQQLFQGVNVPSKAFAEVVEHAFHTPAITAEELDRLRQSGADLKILDSRTTEEFRHFHVPGAISVPGAELVHRFTDVVPSPETLVVVSCAGRTRGIIGAQSLITAGIPNRVVSLRGGTKSWSLAGLDLATGGEGPPDASPAGVAGGQQRAEAVGARFGVPVVDGETATRWLHAEAQERTTYVIDVRSPEEHAAGHIAGVLAVPGGQLVQALDLWVAVRNARIVLVDEYGTRAYLCAHWLRQMGWDAYVLKGQGLVIPAPAGPAGPALPAGVETIAVAEAQRRLADGAVLVAADISADFRKIHAAGAHWVNRARIDRLPDVVLDARDIVVLSADAPLAVLAAGDLHEVARGRIAVVAGGLEAWREAGGAVEASPEIPADADRIDFLFWLHDRNQNIESGRLYLAWEEQLPEQVRREGGGGFVVRPDLALPG